MNTNIVKVTNLTKRYGSNTVFKDLTVKFKKNKISVILGPSGIGKTTLLRCISGLESVDDGSIIIDNESYIERGKCVSKEVLKEVGFVFQNFNLFPHLKVIENLLVVNNDLNLAKYWLDELEILDKQDLYPYQLSGGQRQRVAIARSLMLNPKLICFDEPTSSLDSSLKRSVADIIKRIKKNTSVIIITHDEEFSSYVADELIDFKLLL